MQVEHNTASLPSMIAPFNKGLATAMSRIEDLEVTRLRASDAVLPSDLEKMLARCVKAPTHQPSVAFVNTLAGELCPKELSDCKGMLGRPTQVKDRCTTVAGSMGAVIE